MVASSARYQLLATDIACSSGAPTQRDVCVTVDNAFNPGDYTSTVTLQFYYPDLDDEFTTIVVIW